MLLGASHVAADSGSAAPFRPEYLEDGELTKETQERLAGRYAPILIFHPREEYFPTSPLFPQELLAADGRAVDRDGPRIGWLGTSATRRERYRALALEEKARLATVYYRAYPVRRGAGRHVVLEYWLYYVQNTYRVRGGVLPLWVDSSHPNDLEHIHIVFRDEGSGLVPVELWASSHDGVVPANRYTYKSSDEAFAANGRFLVERGSHALAPDVDGDGVFTPGPDGHSGYRLLWGIRDLGVSRTGYDRSYLDADRTVSSIELAPALDRPQRPGTLTYRLRPVEEISREFAQLQLSDRERQHGFETARHWLRRAFGGNNGDAGKLLIPPERSGGSSSSSIGISHIASVERGFLVGGTFKFQDLGALIGARYAFLHDIGFLPDLIIEANGVQTTRRSYITTQFLLSYPLDASTRIMAGRALVTDSWRFDNRQSDWYAGVELRLGPMRISAASRSWGPITNLSKEFRLVYFF
jgi:hypothetical protein